MLEHDGMIVEQNGIDVDALSAHIWKNGGCKGFQGYVEDSSHGLEEDCDILIPAAFEGVINSNNADNIKAKIILEAANGPITYEADK